jgi:hydrogenase maturation protease
MLGVIGCGNLNRGDDAVGALVARRLAERLRVHPVPGVRAWDCGTAGMEVMFAARGCDALLVLDACRSGAAPGAIFDVPGETLARERDPGYSLHDFRWDHALHAGRKIWGAAFPTDVRVWLIEAESFELGAGLSPEVARAADELYGRALALAAGYALRRAEEGAGLRLTLRRGTLLLPRDVYDRYFGGREGAALFDRGGRLAVVPLASAAGGVLVKRRNAAGDRAVDVAEFLRARGWDDAGEHACEASWDAELGALALTPPGGGAP